jgi:hypothetical protein
MLMTQTAKIGGARAGPVQISFITPASKHR